MQIIDGKLVAKLTRENIAQQVQALPQDKLGKIGLAVILVGDDPASKVYVRNKINGCAEVGRSTAAPKWASPPRSRQCPRTPRSSRWRRR